MFGGKRVHVGYSPSCDLRPGFVHNFDGDGAEGAAFVICPRVLNYPLRVALADRPGVGRGAPRAVPVEVTDDLVAIGGIDEVEFARRARR